MKDFLVAALTALGAIAGWELAGWLMSKWERR